LKVYLRLGWLKLHAYYEKLTSIAYAGVLVMNPYRKLPFLKELWQQIPKATATGYYNDCKRRLAAHWELNYKNREIEGGIEPPSLIDTINYNSYTRQRMQFRNSRQQASDQSQVAAAAAAAMLLQTTSWTS
jgi:hypothetical protein